MALRASISLTDLQASASTERLTASTAYTKSEATGIWIDPDSKNKMLRDELPLADIKFFVIQKPLSDSIPMVDVSAYDFEALKEDSLSLAETFTRAVTYKRAFTDAFTLDDLSQIDKDFYGNKGNIFAFTDIIGLTYNKVFTDSYTVDDVLTKVVAYIRSFTDETTLSDSEYYSLAKNPHNTTTLSDSQSKGFSTNAQDSYYFSDNSVSHTSKVLDNYWLINSTFDDDTGWINCYIPFVGTAYEQSLTAQGIYTFANGYLTFDVLAHQNACVYQRDICPWGTTVQYSVDAKITSGSFSLMVGHSTGATGNKVTFSNSDNQWHTYTGTLVNNGTNSSNEHFYINASGSTIQEPAVVYIDNLQVINPHLVPELSVTDYTSQALGKSLTNDSVSTTEVSNIVLSKALADSFTLDDATQVDKDFYGSKGNVFGFSEVRSFATGKNVTNSVSFTDTTYTDAVKQTNDSVSFSEMQTFVSRKVETDVLPLLEELRNKVTKSNSDSVSFGENVSNMTSRAETDSVSFTDSHSSLINKVDFNSLGFTDSSSSVFRKSVYDSFALDDIAQVNKNVEATKGNAFNFTESITQVVAYKRTVAESCTFDDDYGVQLNKNLTTDIGITDQVTVMHILGSKALGLTALNTNTLN